MDACLMQSALALAWNLQEFKFLCMTRIDRIEISDHYPTKRREGLDAVVLVTKRPKAQQVLGLSSTKYGSQDTQADQL